MMGDENLTIGSEECKYYSVNESRNDIASLLSGL